MLLAFQITLLIVIVFSFFTALGTNNEIGQKATGLCLASIITLTMLILWA